VGLKARGFEEVVLKKTQCGSISDGGRADSDDSRADLFE
jgi:hypothetical protein